jgi:hypothetical protein
MPTVTRPHLAWTSTTVGGPDLWPFDRIRLGGLTAWTARRHRPIPGPQWRVRLIGAPGMVSFRAARSQPVVCPCIADLDAEHIGGCRHAELPTPSLWRTVA